MGAEHDDKMFELFKLKNLISGGGRFEHTQQQLQPTCDMWEGHGLPLRNVSSSSVYFRVKA